MRAEHRASGRARLLGVIRRRLILFPPILLLVTGGVFALSALSPLDPLDSYLNGQSASLTGEQRASIRNELGLDRAWWHIWWDWLVSLAHGDLGQSLTYRQSVAHVFLDRLPWTLLLGTAAVVLALFMSISAALCAALRPGSMIDRAITTTATVLQAMPPFVIGMGAIAVFSVGLHLLPTGGLTEPGGQVTAASSIRHLILPMVVLALSQLPWLVLGLRETLLTTLRHEAVISAQLRGIPRRTIILRHLFPMAAPPFVALAAMRLPELIAGSAIVEAVFAWPGLGAAMVQAAQRLDHALLCFLTLATTAFVLASTLLADLVYLRIDPRVSADV